MQEQTYRTPDEKHAPRCIVCGNARGDPHEMFCSMKDSLINDKVKMIHCKRQGSRGYNNGPRPKSTFVPLTSERCNCECGCEHTTLSGKGKCNLCRAEYHKGNNAWS